MACGTSRPSVAGCPDDGPGHGVFAVGLDRGGQRQQLALGTPPAAATPVTAGSPLVRVPVLSNRTTSIVRIRSSASRFFTSTPARAARSVEMAMTSGMARPEGVRAGDHQTVTVRVTASSTPPSSVQTTNVMSPATGGEVEQERRGPVGQRLRPGRGRLRLGDQPLDPGQRGVVPDGGDPDPQGVVGGDGSGDHRCRRRSADTVRDSPVIIDSSTSACAVDHGRRPRAPAPRSAPVRRRPARKLGDAAPFR